MARWLMLARKRRFSMLFCPLARLHWSWPLAVDADTHCGYHCFVTKKLIKHGNSAALVLDKPLLDLLNVRMDTPLEVTTDGRNIIISPQTSGSNTTDVVATLEKINRKHSAVLKNLA